jgi:hypothetical protein
LSHLCVRERTGRQIGQTHMDAPNGGRLDAGFRCLERAAGLSTSPALPCGRM